MSGTTKQAVFGAACFWGAEAMFLRTSGVVETCVGFMGDSRSGQGCPESDEDAQALRHVEVVVVDYDPDAVSYEGLLNVFWESHDPTRPTYRDDGALALERSVIFTNSEEQRTAADAALSAIATSGRYDELVNTVVDSVGHFHRAREDQQRYLEKNGEAVCSLKTPPLESVDAAE